MGTSNDGTVKIRRPWAEELGWLAVTVGMGIFVIVKFDKMEMLPIWGAYLIGYTVYNRRMGLDLTRNHAIMRRPYRRAKHFAREDISSVTIEKGFVTIRDVAGKPNKLTVMNAAAKFGADRAERTRRQIQAWIDERPAVREPAQMPGSASI